MMNNVLNKSSKMESAIQSKLLDAGIHASSVLPFLSPEVCADPKYRVLYQNTKTKAACPVFQRGIIESSTTDVGDHQSRSIMLVPHAACPVMVSHSVLSNQGVCLFDAKLKTGSRLRDTYRGVYGGNNVLPHYRSFEIPAAIDLAAGATMGLPIHGGFYGATTITGSTAYTPQQQVMYRDFTEVYNGGVATGVRAIPVAATDTVSIVFAGRSTVVYTNAEMKFRIRHTNSTGVITSTEATMNTVSGSGTANTFYAGTVLTVPALAVGLVSAEIVSAAAGSRQFDLVEVRVVHQVNTANSDVSSNGGSFVGVPISGINSLLPVCQSGRVTAISLKLTNTSSTLNTNGFIVAMATQNCTPSSAGVFGENSIASVTTARSFPVADGAYMALAPAIDLDYSSLDSLPGEECPIGLFIVQSQDNTPVTLKLEYNALIEVVSQDPLFAAHAQSYDPEQIRAIQHAQIGSGYLILSENPNHWSEIKATMERVGKFGRKYIVPTVKLASALGVPGAGVVNMGIGGIQSIRRLAKSTQTKPVQRPKLKNSKNKK
jgi:hypothetical protein